MRVLLSVREDAGPLPCRWFPLGNRWFPLGKSPATKDCEGSGH
jgi:hypothetical protein